MLDGCCFASCPADPSVSPFTVFDTEAVPVDERFGRWRGHVAQTLAAFDFDALEDRPFQARMETLSIGDLKIIRSNSTTGSWKRRSTHLSDGLDHAALYLTGGGSFRVVQGDLDSVQGSNHYALIDNGKPSEFFQDTNEDDYGFILPETLWENLGGYSASRPSATAGAPTDSLRLLRGYLASIFASKASFSNSTLLQKVGDHLLDLIVLGLKPSVDVARRAQHRGLKAARVNAILSAIEQNYSAPGISSKTIAAQLHISQRYLNELLEQRGLSFSQIVLEKRLAKALAMLRDPQLDGLRISQIAYECGFNDLSYFNRRFRARFGETPGGIRARST
jgi:AraC-like DNA-binding protein